MRAVLDNPVGRFVEILLRSVGQVVFQNNPLTGLLVIVGVALSSWVAAVDFLIGASVATLAARWLRASEDYVKIGFFGFAGGYVGLIVGAFAGPTHSLPWTELVFFILMGGVLTVPLTSGLAVFFKKFDLPAGPLPIIILFWSLMAGILYTKLPDYAAIPQQLFVEETEVSVYTWRTVFLGVTNGFSEIFVQVNPVTGLLIIAGILVSSRICAAMGVLGGLTAVLVAWFFGHYEPTISEGVMSFNPILTAMALGGFYVYFSRNAVVYAILGSVLAMWAQVVLTVGLSPLGLPPVTLPSVIVVWIMLLGAQTLDFVEPVPLSKVSRPEDL